MSMRKISESIIKSQAIISYAKGHLKGHNTLVIRTPEKSSIPLIEDVTLYRGSCNAIEIKRGHVCFCVRNLCLCKN